MKKPVIAYLGVGTNKGDPAQIIYECMNKLDQTENVSIQRVSSVYETEPIGYLNQPSFHNLVVEIETDLFARELLEFILQIETSMQRVREIRWGPRTIDLDILLYGDIQVNEKGLQIPHPRMVERAFVLVPLHELVGDIYLPFQTMRLSDLIHNVSNQKISLVSKRKIRGLKRGDNFV